MEINEKEMEVLNYYKDHNDTQIQLQEVNDGIYADLSAAIDDQVDDGRRRPVTVGLRTAGQQDWPGGVVEVADRGYLQYVHRRRCGNRKEGRRGKIKEIKERSLPRPGHPLATVWTASGGGQAGRRATGHTHRPYRTRQRLVGIDQLVEIAIRSPPAWTLHGADLRRLASDVVQGRRPRQPARVHWDRAGTERENTTERTYDRLVQRSFEKIRQSARGKKAVLIRQMDALARIMERNTEDDQRQVLLDQADMINQEREESVTEKPEREEVRRQYQACLAVHAQLGGLPLRTRGS